MACADNFSCTTRYLAALIQLAEIQNNRMRLQKDRPAVPTGLLPYFCWKLSFFRANALTPRNVTM